MTVHRFASAIRVAICFFLVALLLTVPVSAKKREVKDYSGTIENFKKIEAVAPFFESAYGYAVFPTIGKGGLGVGASHGKGQVYREGNLIGFTSTTDISIGLQAGGQAYSLIIFFQNADALNEFTGGNFEFGASAEAIAVQAKAEAGASTEGAAASASGHKTGKKATTADSYQNGTAIFSMAKGGLMYAATIAGQKYTYKPVE
jgi:lipid-binding SYLF domain-containing protein